MSRFGAGGEPQGNAVDARLDTPAYHRNIDPIGEVFADMLPDKPANIVEIGCGTGQHVTTLASRFPTHTWWPTDIEPEHLASARAWTVHLGCSNVCEPVELDASHPDWRFGQADRPPEPVDLIFSCNVIHIAPWAVVKGILAGSGRYLSKDGSLLFYGPFRRGGEHTADSNRAFDESLKARNPQWGIRDLDELAALGTSRGLRLADVADMPSNNLTVRFKRNG